MTNSVGPVYVNDHLSDGSNLPDGVYYNSVPDGAPNGTYFYDIDSANGDVYDHKGGSVYKCTVTDGICDFTFISTI